MPCAWSLCLRVFSLLSHRHNCFGKPIVLLCVKYYSMFIHIVNPLLNVLCILLLCKKAPGLLLLMKNWVSEKWQNSSRSPGRWVTVRVWPLEACLLCLLLKFFISHLLLRLRFQMSTKGCRLKAWATVALLGDNGAFRARGLMGGSQALRVWPWKR